MFAIRTVPLAIRSAIVLFQTSTKPMDPGIRLIIFHRGSRLAFPYTIERSSTVNHTFMTRAYHVADDLLLPCQLYSKNEVRTYSTTFDGRFYLDRPFSSSFRHPITHDKRVHVHSPYWTSRYPLLPPYLTRDRSWVSGRSPSILSDRSPWTRRSILTATRHTAAGSIRFFSRFAI